MLEELLELSHNRADNLVTPLILEYYTIEAIGYEPQQIMTYLKAKYEVD